MWRERAIWVAVSLAGLVLAGCSSMGGGWRQESPPSATTRPTTRPTRLPDQADRELEQAFDLVVAGEYDQARPKLARLIQEFGAAGDDERAARGMLWLSFCYEKTGKKNQAEIFYRRIVTAYGDTSAAETARVRLEQLGLPGGAATAE